MTTTATRNPGATLLGRVLKLAERMTTPLVPADYLDVIDPLRSGINLRGRIVGIRPETRDAATLVIRPGRGWRTHVPGQYLRIGVDVDGVRRWRAYSLTSPATQDAKTVSITVKAMPEGFLSGHLVDGIAPGTIVRLAAPQGNFVLPDPAPSSVLFVT